MNDGFYLVQKKTCPNIYIGSYFVGKCRWEKNEFGELELVISEALRANEIAFQTQTSDGKQELGLQFRYSCEMIFGNRTVRVPYHEIETYRQLDEVADKHLMRGYHDTLEQTVKAEASAKLQEIQALKQARAQGPIPMKRKDHGSAKEIRR